MGNKKTVKGLIIVLVAVVAWGGWMPCPKKKPGMALNATLSGLVRVAPEVLVVADNNRNSSSRCSKQRSCCCRHAMPCVWKLQPMIASARLWHPEDSQRVLDCVSLDDYKPGLTVLSVKPAMISPDVHSFYASLRTVVLLV
ncbi:MAG: hypothetical protein AB1473_02910 [Thermodesulfobacteriota bacterium]